MGNISNVTNYQSLYSYRIDKLKAVTLPVYLITAILKYFKIIAQAITDSYAGRCNTTFPDTFN